MVPRVEGFHTELEAAAARFVEHEALEQREVPVVAARPAECVVAQIAKCTERREERRLRIVY